MYFTSFDLDMRLSSKKNFSLSQNRQDKWGITIQGLLDLDGRNSQKYLHQTWAYF